MQVDWKIKHVKVSIRKTITHRKKGDIKNTLFPEYIIAYSVTIFYLLFTANVNNVINNERAWKYFW